MKPFKIKSKGKTVIINSFEYISEYYVPEVNFMPEAQDKWAKSVLSFSGDGVLYSEMTVDEIWQQYEEYQK
jgi:hypothetical protein